MSKRNTVFGGLALVVAGAAVAGGAAVSSSAMADGGSPKDELNTVHMISITDDGEAIECTFENVDLPTFIDAPAGNGGSVVAVSGSGTINGSLPIGEPSAVEGEAVIVTSTATALPGGGQGVVLLSADDARQGTPEECAAMNPMATPTP
jgi:hypothetical protein